jgi:hypothetical protein
MKIKRPEKNETPSILNILVSGSDLGPSAIKPVKLPTTHNV